MTRLADVIYKVTGVIVGLLLAILTLLVGASVFWRYVLRDSITWSQDVSIFLLIYLTFFGASMGLRRGEMVSFDLVLRKLARRPAARWLWLFGQLSIAGYLVITLYYGVIEARMNVGQSSPVLGFLNMGVPYAAVPIGAAMMLLYVVEAILKGYSPPPESGTR